jgi:hypothetical protein
MLKLISCLSKVLNEIIFFHDMFGYCVLKNKKMKNLQEIVTFYKFNLTKMFALTKQISNLTKDLRHKDVLFVTSILIKVTIFINY